MPIKKIPVLTQATKRITIKDCEENVARTARSTTSQRQTAVVKEDVVIQQIAKPLNPELKANIEKLIAAKIIFLLKQNQPSIKSRQCTTWTLSLFSWYTFSAKDEFAVNQLINHIRSLGLDEIVAQAEDKQKSAQAENPIESIAFEPATSNTTETNKNHAAFDALIDQPATTEQQTQDSLEFDTTDIDNTSNDSLQEQVQPLEFNLESITQKKRSQLLIFSLKHLHLLRKQKPQQLRL